MSAIAEKGGGFFQGIKLLLCENPLLPIDEAIAAAQAGVPHSNFYTEPYPTKTYFFLADFAPHDAFDIADQLRSRNILIKPLNDPALGPGYSLRTGRGQIGRQEILQKANIRGRDCLPVGAREWRPDHLY